MDRDRILDEIRRTAQENGGEPLGKGRFAKATGIKESDWSGRFWARWSDAVAEAGFTPNEMQGRYDEPRLLTQLADAIEHFGHVPTTAERKLYGREHPGFPSHNTIARLGGRGEQAARLLAQAEELGLSDEVRAICEAEAVPEEPDHEGVQSRGFVYLMKMGKYHKIGRSNDPARRAYEVRLKMPEKVTLVHEIETDDPEGIEAYWHRRFADRRAEGEWFELSRDDVRAFRSRETM